MEEVGEIYFNIEYKDSYKNIGDFSFLQDVLIQRGLRITIDPGWILMDNKSITDVFSNPRLLHNICHARGNYITIN